VFPTLEDVTDSVGAPFPRNVLVGDHAEKCKAVLRLLTATDREATWWDGKRTKMWPIEVAIEGTRERPVRGDHPVVRSDFGIELA